MAPPEKGENKEEVKELIKGKEREKEELVMGSIGKIDELGKKLLNRELDKDTYNIQVKDIENQISSMDSQIRSLKSELVVDKTKSAKTDHEGLGITKYLVIPALLIVVLFYLYMNSACIGVNVSTMAPKILSLLDLIKERSRQDYNMICSYVEAIDYRGGRISRANKGKIQMSSRLLEDQDDELIASVIVHEACHNMISDIMGGFGGMTEEDVERPCERMRYMFLYRVGSYRTYMEMVDALSNEKYGRQRLLKTAGIPAALKPYWEHKVYQYDTHIKPYCASTDLRVDEIEVGNHLNLRLSNVGETTIHCGFIELIVNELEYPLDCTELTPGQSHLTGGNFRMFPDDSYGVRVVGCDK